MFEGKCKRSYFFLRECILDVIWFWINNKEILFYFWMRWNIILVKLKLSWCSIFVMDIWEVFGMFIGVLRYDLNCVLFVFFIFFFDIFGVRIYFILVFCLVCWEVFGRLFVVRFLWWFCFCGMGCFFFGIFMIFVFGYIGVLF